MPVVLTLCAGPAFAQRPPAPPLTAQPQWITPAASGPGLEQGTFESRAAGAAVSYHIYIPPGYASEPGRRFPVIYWLHGSGGGISGVAPLARQFDGAIRAYRAYAKKVPNPDGSYTIDHTALVYLMDKNGGFVVPFNLQRRPEESAADLRKYF